MSRDREALRRHAELLEDDMARRKERQIREAALDLLEALKAVLNIDNPPADEPGHVDLPYALKMAAQAIAKAEGR